MKKAYKIHRKERLAWALHVLAVSREAEASRWAEQAVDKEEARRHLVLAMAVDVLVRIKLCGEFACNLDTLYAEAQDMYAELLEEVKRKQQEEDERAKLVDKALQALDRN